METVSLIYVDRVPAKNGKMPGKCAGYRPGIPQQPYTKWDTEKDEVEVDYKQLEEKHAHWFSGRKGIVLRILIVLVVFSLGLIMGYVVRRSVHELILSPAYKSKCAYTNGHEGYSLDLSEELRKFIDAESIEANLREYTAHIHLTATQKNNALRDLLARQFGDYHLRVRKSKYNVLLSYPDWENPNTIYLLNESGAQMYQTEYKGPHSIHHPEVQPYSAFAPNGTVTGDLVYANYGEIQDFEELVHIRRKVDIKDKIVLMRYGRIHRGEKVKNAEKYGAKGVILYSDPEEVQAMYVRPDELFPHSWWLPGWAVQRGSVRPDSTGDPLTPGWPSLDGIYRLDQSEAALPRIPVQPIGYDEAHEIMMDMSGPIGPNSFLGAMSINISYHVGPGYGNARKGWKVQLEVNNEREQRYITDVFGIIEGKEEPDRYVIVGCHYDAWLFGGVDSNSGTALMMEIAKAFGNMTQKGWRPRRSIIFAHWDAEEQGMMGSYEWVEEHADELANKAVAYINLDSAITGNYTLKVQSTPLLRNLAMDASRLLRPVYGGTDAEDTMSLFHQWVQRSPDDDDNSQPKINPVGGDSDQAAFVYKLGIPALYPRYTYNHAQTSGNVYPAYHTAIDNFTLVKEFVDPSFLAHKTLADFVGEITLKLATSTKLPIDAREYARTLGEEFNSLRASLQNDNYQSISKLDILQWAIGNFTSEANEFMEFYYNSDMSDPLEVRRLNDKLMQISRAFIHPKGLPGRPQFKNILFSASSVDNYKASTFTGIRDAFINLEESPGEKTDLSQQLDYQITIATLAVQSASNILSESIIT